MCLQDFLLEHHTLILSSLNDSYNELGIRCKVECVLKSLRSVILEIEEKVEISIIVNLTVDTMTII
jgi:hypothetical protein